MNELRVTLLGMVVACLVIGTTQWQDREEMIQASAMRSKKYRDWHYKDLEAKCTKNVHCIHTGFCNEDKGKCCAPHGYACISKDNCCSEKHICGGRYAKSCINPPPPNSPEV